MSTTTTAPIDKPGTPANPQRLAANPWSTTAEADEQSPPPPRR